jgi:hypothetical protein
VNAGTVMSIQADPAQTGPIVTAFSCH